jgi:hypothetical protein
MSSSPVGAFAAASAAVSALAWPELTETSDAQGCDDDGDDSTSRPTVLSIVSKSICAGADGALGSAA